jgi:2-iminobutanoate/2-iminopropanoate deaminase
MVSNKMSNKEVIRAADAPTPVGPYNQAIAVPATSKLIFLAGQVAINPTSGKIEANTVEAQTEQVIQNIKAVLAAAGADLSHVVKTTVFLANMADFPTMNGVYSKYFLDPAPARSTIQVARLPLDALVEIECTAALD